MIEQRSPEGEKKEPKIRNIGFLITLLCLAALIPLASKFYMAYQEKVKIHQEKLKEEQHLRQEVDRLKDRTEEMKEQERYLQTYEGAERVARDKLGLTKPNEIPLVIKKSSGSSAEEPVLKNKKENEENKESNAENISQSPQNTNTQDKH